MKPATIQAIAETTPRQEGVVGAARRASMDFRRWKAQEQDRKRAKEAQDQAAADYRAPGGARRRRRKLQAASEHETRLQDLARRERARVEALRLNVVAAKEALAAGAATSKLTHALAAALKAYHHATGVTSDRRPVGLQAHLLADCSRDASRRRRWFGAPVATKHGVEVGIKGTCCREDCVFCGPDEDPKSDEAKRGRTGQMRAQRYTPEVLGLALDHGCAVLQTEFTLPRELRERARSLKKRQRAFRAVADYMRDELGMVAGWRSWHPHGDQNTVYHPHVHVVWVRHGGTGRLTPEELQGLKEVWARAWGWRGKIVVNHHFALQVDSHVANPPKGQELGIARLWHIVGYVARPFPGWSSWRAGAWRQAHRGQTTPAEGRTDEARDIIAAWKLDDLEGTPLPAFTDVSRVSRCSTAADRWKAYRAQLDPIELRLVDLVVHPLWGTGPPPDFSLPALRAPPIWRGATVP